MKRIAIAGVALALCIVAFFAMGSYGQFVSYFEAKEDIEATRGTISSMKSDIATLGKELSDKRGDEVPKTLAQIMTYVGDFDGVSIDSIKAFEIDGNSLHFIKNITNPNDDTLCDGYEINLTVKDMLGFIQYFDESHMSYNSIDLLFGSETIILRVRTGGGV